MPCAGDRRAPRDEFVPALWTGQAPPGVTIEQVWFAGAHSDVGGGYLARRLADIPLVWMARKAEQEGLSLDWSCLPDPNSLDPAAPLHDSRTLLFAKDRIMPTLRQVCGQPVDVPFYQRLCAPTDSAGKPIPTINEVVHQSVLTRYGTTASACKSDEHATCTLETYAPSNIAALLDAEGQPMPGIRVEP
jgi:hypothetical protein